MSVTNALIYLKNEVDNLLVPGSKGQANLFNSNRTYNINDIVRLTNGGEVISLVANNTQDPNTSFTGGGGCSFGNITIMLTQLGLYQMSQPYLALQPQ